MNPTKGNLLPKYILEKHGLYYQIWDTVLHEVVRTFETKERALSFLSELK